MPTNNELLYSLLKESQYINLAQLDKAVKSAQENREDLYDTVLDKDLLSDEELGRIIADHYNVPFIKLSQLSIDPNIVKLLPSDYCRSNLLMVIEIAPDYAKIATANIDKTYLLDFIKKKLNREIKLVFATKKDILDKLSSFKALGSSSLDKIVERLSIASNNPISISDAVQAILEESYNLKASDIHLEPLVHDAVIRFRVDGVLHDVVHLSKDLHLQVVTKIKVLSRVRIDEHFSAQDGKFKFEVGDETIDVRASIVPTVEGEKVVLRLLTKTRQFNLSDLGMSQEDLDKVRRGFNRSYGMVLSTGPTGSGKTTTIYAILKILNERQRNIASIEDPVEYEVEGINQIQVNPTTNLTFAEGLRALLRQDPNVIFVGEIRDKETAGISINSALTGHLVLSTMHTNNAATTLLRFVDMGIEPFLVTSTLKVIVAQRLLRKTCDRCKSGYDFNVSELKKVFSAKLVDKYFANKDSVRLYKGKGCDVCHNTGYVGRVGIFEVLEVTPEIEDLVTSKANIDAIINKAVEQGMRPMLENALDKVQRGITTMEEVIRALGE